MNTPTNTIPDAAIEDFARALIPIIQDFRARPGQWEKYRVWYEAQMAAGNPLGLKPEKFDEVRG